MRSFSQVRLLISLFTFSKPLERQHRAENSVFRAFTKGISNLFSKLGSSLCAVCPCEEARATTGLSQASKQTSCFLPPNSLFSLFSGPLSPTELDNLLSKRLPLTLACMAFECLLLLVTSPGCCHAYFILLTGLCTVAASWKGGSFFTVLAMAMFSVLTFVEESFYLREQLVFYVFLHLSLERALYWGWVLQMLICFGVSCLQT